MVRLLIDIGNSSIKAILGTDKLISKSFKKTFYNKNKFKNEFNIFIKKNYISHRGEINSVGISLCDDKFKKICNEVIKENFNLQPFFISFNNKLPIKIDYPKTLGKDRICSSVSAVKKYKNNPLILVIDYGTATTFNLIKNKTFIGGIIAPGVGTCLKSLLENTNLPKVKIDLKKTNIISKDTQSAIISGVYYQTLVLSNFVIQELQKKYRNLIIICTGGFGELFSKSIKKIKSFYPNLVLEGINEILKFNKK